MECLNLVAQLFVLSSQTFYMKQSDLDLKDSPADEAKLQPEFTTIDMPEVKDIPGQEHIHPPKMNQFADITASSDDEEGVGVLDSLNDPTDEDEELIAGDDAEIPADNDADDEVPHDEHEDIDDGEGNVTDQERDLLESAEHSTSDADDLTMADSDLDDTDGDGEPLEEKSFKDDRTGGDLDVPGSEEDDAEEAIGNEDEENNAYSGDQKNETYNT